MPTSARRRLASATMAWIRPGSRTSSRGRIGTSARSPGSVERDALVPVRHVDLEPECLDLRREGGLGLRVTVDQEDGPREAIAARFASRGEAPEPVQELRLVGVGGEAADRADPAADLADLAVEPDRGLPRLEVRAEGALALVAHEQDRRSGVVD